MDEGKSPGAITAKGSLCSYRQKRERGTKYPHGLYRYFTHEGSLQTMVLKQYRELVIHALMLKIKSSTVACFVVQHQQRLAIISAYPKQPQSHSTKLTINSRANRLPILPDQCTSIVIESNHHSILPLHLLGCPYYDCVPDVSSSHFVSCSSRCIARSAVAHRARLLYDDYNTITFMRVSCSVVRIHCQHSPIFPCLFIRRFATHSTIVAPELSIQFSIV